MGWLAYLVGIFLPYVALAVFVAGFIYRVVCWSRAPRHLPWELFPYPRTAGERVGEMVMEVVSLRSLKLHNKNIWLPSLLMHWGIYLVAGWLFLVLVGCPVGLLGYLGGLAAAGGSLWMFAKRLCRGLKILSTPVEYLNLLLVFLISAGGIISGFFGEGPAVREYAVGLLSLAPRLPSRPSLLWEIFFLEIFLLYLPFGRMIHFAAKYFTYHRVKWGESH
ncbi:nitrate reductase [Thermanaeromonas sp. C210]|uniref:nitrate reductase n=1 Tax=Thermanaeromonas sp. C210 TaxID=2731925 RepID=UPI00155D202E|nr:nitrate reductase [Thermanaeromonas sp. C210]GFN23241.1 nitrate reductase [Thermanaeromonas sp. C210]